MKINEVERIYERWVGGFISSQSAMCKIGEILKSKEMTNVNVFVEGKMIGQVDKMLISYK